MLNYNKNDVAPFPPMGWNSYDYYNTTVNEAQVRQNAEYMAKNLKKYGWEYVVIDIQWSDPDAGKQNKNGVQYIPFSRFCIDEFSRQIPAENRFPSSAGGLGFKPLADYIHSFGLKFGIHIMRGIPRFAAHEHLPIKTHDGTKITADMIANPYSAEKEIEMIANAIENCGRQMVLSLSPGPAVIEKAHHYKNFANMWRITDDFWDDWKLLKAMFERCEVWQSHTGEGNWPDCDMLPMNVLGYGWGDMNSPENKGWKCKFTQEESRTMVTLWSIFRAPLMIGTDLPQLDDFSLSLLTNEEILAMNKNPLQAYQASSSCNENIVIWVNECPDQKSYYECIFNLSDEVQTVKLNLKVGNHDNIRDLWERKDLGNCSEFVLEPHSCKALKISL